MAVMYTFWFNYEWPSIKGNGPEDITSLVIVGIITALLIPAVRRWLKARAERVKAAEEALHAKLDHNARLLAHIIKHHPDIPNEDHNGESLIGESGASGAGISPEAPTTVESATPQPVRKTRRRAPARGAGTGTASPADP